jgi:hypothetical protein
MAFSNAQRQDLEQLRDRYRQGGDFLSVREITSLLFARWLYESGRVEP